MKRTKLDDVFSKRKETKAIEFKEKFDINSVQDWCEIIKDIVAIANSGGGFLLFFVDDDGNAVCKDIDDLLELDNALIADKIYSYTGVHFCDIEISEGVRDNLKIAIFSVGATKYPLVFIKEG